MFEDGDCKVDGVLVWKRREAKRRAKSRTGEMVRSHSDHLFLGRLCYDCSFLFPLFT